MRQIEQFIESRAFIVIVVCVILAAILVHTTVVFASFSVVEDRWLRYATALLFSVPISLLVLVFTIHKSNEKDWEFDASGWLATGTALIFILYMKPWHDLSAAAWHNGALKVITGAMIGIGEYALPRLYLKMKKQDIRKKYVSPWDDGFQTDDPAAFKSYLGGKIGGKPAMSALKKQISNKK